MDIPESNDFQQEILNLEAMLDALPPEDRGTVMQQLRDAMTATGDQLSAEDVDLCDRFAQGAINIHQVQQHFGNRLWQAFGARPDSEEAGGAASNAQGARP
jgi:hypothetical protein